MTPKENNYAFIDSQNFYQGIKELGWNIDWHRFRTYLTHKYRVTKAFIFIGHLKERKNMYEFLSNAGFILIFKPVVKDHKGRVKGNVDADLVLQTMITKDEFDKAVIVSSDGDFYSLVKYLKEQGKLKIVLSSRKKTCSYLLRNQAKGKIHYCDTLKNKIGA